MGEIEEGMGALKAKLGRILTKPKVFFAGLALGGVIVAVLFIPSLITAKLRARKKRPPIRFPRRSCLNASLPRTRWFLHRRTMRLSIR